MKLFEHSYKDPFKNILIDEYLLSRVDTTKTENILRIWEPKSTFVVLGYGKKCEEETFKEKCIKDNIPILKRCTGGGTVLQGKGCLNYSLILRIDTHTSNITSTTNYILEKTKRCLLRLINDIEINGTSDLTYKGKKISGNAQRRKKNAVLFHGTLLYNMDISLVEKYLTLPKIQPKYRNQKPHTDFIQNIPIKKEMIRQALIEEWKAKAKVEDSLTTFHIDNPLSTKIG